MCPRSGCSGRSRRGGCRRRAAPGPTRLDRLLDLGGAHVVAALVLADVDADRVAAERVERHVRDRRPGRVVVAEGVHVRGGVVRGDDDLGVERRPARGPRPRARCAAGSASARRTGAAATRARAAARGRSRGVHGGSYGGYSRSWGAMDECDARTQGALIAAAMGATEDAAACRVMAWPRGHEVMSPEGASAPFRPSPRRPGRCGGSGPRRSARPVSALARVASPTTPDSVMSRSMSIGTTTLGPAWRMPYWPNDVHGRPASFTAAPRSYASRVARSMLDALAERDAQATSPPPRRGSSGPRSRRGRPPRGPTTARGRRGARWSRSSGSRRP